MIFTTLENKNSENKSEAKAGRTPAFSRFKIKPVVRKIAATAGAAVFWLIIWYALSSAVDREILLPSPLAVLSRLWQLMSESDFWISCGTTLLRIFCGLVLGCAAGILLSALMTVSKSVRALVYPLLSAVKSTPVASFIIIALVWISRVKVPAFISFLIVLPIICDAVYAGVRNTDKGLIETAHIFKFSFYKRLRYLYIPSAVPYFLSALRTSVGMAWKSGVAAEVLCTPKNSIGGALYLSKVYMESADLFAWTLTIIVLSIIFEKLTVILVKKGLAKFGAAKEIGDA